jgi:hypothetical protein
MLPYEQGIVFSALLHSRMITDNPQGRHLRKNEAEAARYLSNCSERERRDFDDFLSAQGLAVKSFDAINFGIVPNPKCCNQIHVLHRCRGEKLAPFFDQGWFIDEMRDQRSKSSKADIIIWFSRLWLTLQYFFYNRISRHPQQISQYDKALVFTERFTEVVKKGIEDMGNAGRPDGEAGVMWDVLWGDNVKVESWVAKFMRVMLKAGVIEETGVKNEYRQSLSTAVDMALNADYDLTYLMPPENLDEIADRSIMLITGAPLPAGSSSREVQDATDK